LEKIKSCTEKGECYDDDDDEGYDDESKNDEEVDDIFGHRHFRHPRRETNRRANDQFSSKTEKNLILLSDMNEAFDDNDDIDDDDDDDEKVDHFLNLGVSAMAVGSSSSSSRSRSGILISDQPLKHLYKNHFIHNTRPSNMTVKIGKKKLSSDDGCAAYSGSVLV
jgi:hypothetical protein